MGRVLGKSPVARTGRRDGGHDKGDKDMSNTGRRGHRGLGAMGAKQKLRFDPIIKSGPLTKDETSSLRERVHPPHVLILSGEPGLLVVETWKPYQLPRYRQRGYSYYYIINTSPFSVTSESFEIDENEEDPTYIVLEDGFDLYLRFAAMVKVVDPRDFLYESAVDSFGTLQFNAVEAYFLNLLYGIKDRIVGWHLEEKATLQDKIAKVQKKYEKENVVLCGLSADVLRFKIINGDITETFFRRLHDAGFVIGETQYSSLAALFNWSHILDVRYYDYIAILKEAFHVHDRKDMDAHFAMGTKPALVGRDGSLPPDPDRGRRFAAHVLRQLLTYADDDLEDLLLHFNSSDLNRSHVIDMIRILDAADA